MQELASTQNNHITDAKITVNQKDLSLALLRANTVADKKNMLPEFSNLLMEVRDNNLHVIATDLDLIMREVLLVEASCNVEISVNAGLLYDIVKRLDERHKVVLELDSEDGMLKITSQGSHFSIPVSDPKNFPILDDDTYDLSFNIPGNALRRLINCTKFSASQDEARRALSGIYLHQQNKALVCTALDGHRLAFAQTPDLEIPEFNGVIISKKTATEFIKILDGINSELTLSISSNKIKLSNSTFSVSSKLVDAIFPAYSGLIPTQHQIQITVPTREFKHAVERASAIANEKLRGLLFLIHQNTLTLSGRSDVNAYSKEVIDLQGQWFEKAFEVGINFRYVLEILSTIEEDAVTLKFNDPFSAVVITSSNPNNYWIIMPMRV